MTLDFNRSVFGEWSLQNLMRMQLQVTLQQPKGQIRLKSKLLDDSQNAHTSVFLLSLFYYGGKVNRET